MQKFTQRRKLTEKGFTLIELMVVMTLLAILAGFMVPRLSDFIEKSKITAAVATGDCLVKAFALFAAAHPESRFPTEIASYRDLAAVANRHGCYLPPEPDETGFDPDDPPLVAYRETWCYERDPRGGVAFPLDLTTCPPAELLYQFPALDLEIWLEVPGVNRPPDQEVIVAVSTFRGVRVLEGGTKSP